jgi:NAD(P)-dependent dehydrogenase (short-subunit alcohol dehydrogenase family)
MDIRGADAVVTGAGVGSGLAIAERLLDDGARVVLTDLAETEALTALRDRAGERAAFVPADLTVDADVERVVDAAAATFGGL